MKKIIIASVAAAALLTSAQADFNFGEMFKDMKEAAFTINKDTQDAPAKVSTANSTHDCNHAASTDTKNAEDTSKSMAQK